MSLGGNFALAVFRKIFVLTLNTPEMTAADDKIQASMTRKCHNDRSRRQLKALQRKDTDNNAV